jgi:hypothetical protein
MRKSCYLFISLVAIAGIVGCGAAATSNEDIKSAAGELNKSAAGVTPQPDPDVAQVGGAGAAGKPGSK